MIYKIIKEKYLTLGEDVIELIVEDSCGNQFQGILKLNKFKKENGNTK